jgi:hypothetical protein
MEFYSLVHVYLLSFGEIALTVTVFATLANHLMRIFKVITKYFLQTLFPSSSTEQMFFHELIAVVACHFGVFDKAFVSKRGQKG